MYYCTPILNAIKLHIKKLLSIVLITTVLLPFAIQFSHSFEEHDHLACNKEQNVHIHNHEFECSIFHFNFNTNSIEFPSIENFTEKDFIRFQILTAESQPNSVLFYSKSSRAPPYLLFA